ncbi:MAG TPA: hypothetical protein DCE23_00315 [Firmicutes bacterium]|nr:hypothetical protein [Bacillota bacterium]
MKKEKISFNDKFYIFLFGCLLGWVVEGIWTFLKKGVLINHSALVIGPFNIVYGIGALVLSVTLHKLQDKSNITIFATSFVAGTALEYILSYLMEMMFGFTAWSYKSKPFNIHGRVCLPYSIFWGILGLLWLKLIHKRLMNFLKKIDKKESNKFITIMIIFLTFNVMLTIGAINRGKAYEQGIAPRNKTEIMYDKYFGVDYLNNMFNNRWNKK